MLQVDQKYVKNTINVGTHTIYVAEKYEGMVDIVLYNKDARAVMYASVKASGFGEPHFSTLTAVIPTDAVERFINVVKTVQLELSMKYEKEREEHVLSPEMKEAIRLGVHDALAPLAQALDGFKQAMQRVTELADALRNGKKHVAPDDDENFNFPSPNIKSGK